MISYKPLYWAIILLAASVLSLYILKFASGRDFIITPGTYSIDSGIDWHE